MTRLSTNSKSASFILLIAWMLIVSTTFSIPLTLSKMIASASAASSARVAKWDIVISKSPTNNAVARRYVNINGASSNPNTIAETFKIYNKSEVAAKVTLVVTYVTDAASIPVGTGPKETNVTITASSLTLANAATAAHHGIWIIPANTEGEFTMTFSRPATTTLTGTEAVKYFSHKCMLFYEAEQID